MKVYRLSDVRKYVETHSMPEPIIGEAEAALIGERTNTVIYGPAGSAKTTLMNDMGHSLAQGHDWLGFPVPKARRVLLIENEGNRDYFMAKMERKTRQATGQVDENLFVATEIGSLRENGVRRDLALKIQALGIDVVVMGPVTTLGFDQAGTVAETREFMSLIDEMPRTDESYKRMDLMEHVYYGPLSVRDWQAQLVWDEIEGEAERRGREQADGLTTREWLKRARVKKSKLLQAYVKPVAFILIQHENRAGTVSGRWEGVVDTLLAVVSPEHGKTRVFIEKARNASRWHGRTFDLTWETGERFAVEAKQTGEAGVWSRIAAAVHDEPGSSWATIKKLVRGVGDEIKTKVRDDHLASGELVNLVQGKATYECPPRMASHLYLPSDLAATVGLADGGEAGAGLGLSPLKGGARPLQPQTTPPTEARSLTGFTSEDFAEGIRPKLDHCLRCAEHLRWPVHDGKLNENDWRSWHSNMHRDLSLDILRDGAIAEVDAICDWLEAGTRGEWSVAPTG